MLKKEFKKKDVIRARNLITGKYNDQTQTLIGYEKNQQKYKEGDIWEEDGKKWTISNGLKIRISKRAQLKNKVSPLFCPKCNKPLSSHLDKKFFKINGFCFDCTIKMEDDLKIEGKYEEWTKNQLIKSYESYLEDLENGVNEIIDEINKLDFMTEDGKVEDWEGNVEFLKDKLKEQITKLREEINQNK